MSPVPWVVTQHRLFPRLEPIASSVSGTTYEGSSSTGRARENTWCSPNVASGASWGMAVTSIICSLKGCEKGTILSRCCLLGHRVKAGPNGAPKLTLPQLAYLLQLLLGERPQSPGLHIPIHIRLTTRPWND